MRRVIINLDPMEQDTKTALERTMNCIRHYVGVLKRDGQRITATWDSFNTIFIYHDKTKESCIYSPAVKEEKRDWFRG